MAWAASENDWQALLESLTNPAFGRFLHPTRFSMGLFSRKPKVQLRTFSAEFYDRNFLRPPLIAGIDVARKFYETVKSSVSEADPQFTLVDDELLVSELIVIRFEVFGLAWFHQQGDRRAAEQSDFTRLYLDRANRTTIWKSMEAYNQAVARSGNCGHTLESRTGRAYVVFTNKMRIELFEKGKAQGFDDVAVARATNRLFTDVAWKKGITAGFLALTLCDRLKCQSNEQGQFRLATVIKGFYDGVAVSLKALKIES